MTGCKRAPVDWMEGGGNAWSVCCLEKDASSAPILASLLRERSQRRTRCRKLYIRSHLARELGSESTASDESTSRSTYAMWSIGDKRRDGHTNSNVLGRRLG